MKKRKKVILIEDELKIERMLLTLFIACDIEGILRQCSLRSGYGHNVIFLLLKEDFDIYGMEEDDFELPYPLDDRHALLEFALMGIDEVELAYLDFPTLYHYLDKRVTYLMQEDSSRNLLPLLEEARKGLLGE